VKIVVSKYGRGLMPANRKAEELIGKYADGELLTVDLRPARNVAHHRKLFAMLQLVFESQEKYPTIEHLLTAVKLEAGWYHDALVEWNGTLVYVPKSIDFEKCSQHGFDEFYPRAVAAVHRLLPHLDAMELEDEVDEFAA